MIPDFYGKYIFSHEDGPKLLHFSVQCAKLKEYEVIVHGTLRNGLTFERKFFTMAYKIQRKEGTEGSTIYTYTAPGHNICTPTRLFDPAGGPNGVDDTKMIMGITHFEVGGGCDYGANPLESIYYILKGQMTLKTETEETVLHEGDCFKCSGGTPKSVTNTGDCVCDMLVCLLPPQA